MRYLLTGGDVVGVSSKAQVDVLDGERIDAVSVIREDDLYAWSSLLAYYVDEYDVMLPEPFVNHILESSESAA